MNTHTPSSSSHQSFRLPRSTVYNSSSLQKCTNFKNKLYFFFFFLNILYIHTGSTPAPPPQAHGGERLAATDANFKKISILNRCSAVTHPNPLVVSTRAPQYPILWSVWDHRRASRNQEDGKVQIYRQIQVINIFKSNLKKQHQCNKEWRSVGGAASFSRHRLTAA